MNPPLPERRDGHGSATAILLRRYHEQGDHLARERLIELYLPLVAAFTGRYARGSDDYDDLYQVGCIGLINAIDRFEFERGDELAAYAVPNIAGEIKRYLRDRGANVRLPRRIHELRGPATRLQADLRVQLGRAPTAAEVAEKLGARESDVELALGTASAAITLDHSPEPHASEPGFEDVDDRLFLVDATRDLDERQRRILYLRYVRDLEPEDVARELRMSQRQLSRATRAALRTLRMSLEDGGPPQAAPATERSDRGLPPPEAEPKMAQVPTLDAGYHIELTKDAPDGGWTAQVKELPGCSAQGGTPEEAARGVEEAMRQWIAEARAERREVPRPRAASSHSGRLLVRMPQSLHAELARAAAREEVSLNQFITSSLASAVGWRQDEGGLRAAIVANIVVLAILAVVAVALLVIAFARGF